MPKPKPTHVVRHEIVFGRTEKDLLDTLVFSNSVLVGTKSFNLAVSPIISLFKDISAMTIILVSIAAYLGWEFIVAPGGETVGGLLDQFKAQWLVFQQSEKAQEATEDVLTAPVTLVTSFLNNLFGILPDLESITQDWDFDPASPPPVAE